MKKKTLGLMAGTVLMSSIAQVLAAGPIQTDAPMVIKPLQADAGKAPNKRSRLIVKYRNAVTSDTAAVSTLKSAATRAGLVRITSTGKSTSTTPTLGLAMIRKQATGARVMRASRKLSDTEMSSLLKELRADPSVEYAEEDVMLRPLDDLARPATDAGAQLTPDDPRYSGYQWHLQDGPGGIHAPAAWDASTGKGVVVAVLDTGILPEHPDLKKEGHILTGYDFITDSFVSRRDSDARVPGAQDYGDWNDDGTQCDVGSSSWHGTHTSGTVGELTNNGVGGAGVAFDAQVLPVRVLGRCGGYTSDIADAIVWASGGHVEGVPDNTTPAEVISLSLGGGGTCQASTQQAINTAVANGSTVVVAAGNNAANVANYSPASCDNVIVVGATRITGGIAYYSNYGAKVDLSGPGGGGSEDTGNGGWDGYVLQTGYTGTTTPDSGEYAYSGQAGTSMATPHVAATAALVQSALVAAGKDPLSPADMESLLKKTSTPFAVTPPGSKPIGTGIVHADLAIKQALCDAGAQDCQAPVVELSNKVARNSLASTEAREALYSFTAQAGTVLTFMTYSGNGNVQLYARYGEEPDASSYDARSIKAGTSQTVRFTAAKAGTYYVKLIGGTGGYSGVSLMARQ